MLLLRDADVTEERFKTSTTSQPEDHSLVYVSGSCSWFYGSIGSPSPDHREQGLGYRALFEADEEGGYVATIPALEGCTTEGDTLDEAYEYLRDALDGWMQVAREKGLEIPQPDIKMIP